MSACTVGFAPSAVRPERGTCKSSCSRWRMPARFRVRSHRRCPSRHPCTKRRRTKVDWLKFLMKPITRVNDFVVKFANVNGSGSASANGLFAKSVLKMGVPVAARNIFPSNIQGLPTWYEVRVVEAGWRGRRGGVDLMVAMNAETWEQDVAEVEP